MPEFQLIFIPSPGLSHLVSTVETAKLLLNTDARLSITVLIMNLTKESQVQNYIEKISSHSDQSMSRLLFLHLPTQNPDPSNPKTSLFDSIDNQTPNVRDIVRDSIEKSSKDGTFEVAGLVLDMFCTKFIDVANEFGLPSYVFFTSGACALGLFFHIAELKFDHGQELTKFENSEVELSVKCFSIPVPSRVLPAVFVKPGPFSDVFLNYFKRFAEAEGILVNTFRELEPFAVESLSDGKTPRVYPVGPILNLSDQSFKTVDDIIENWLDEQPDCSVVFLCFGSMGSFEEAQVKEIAIALERSGQRFLWSLRKPGPKGTKHFPTEYVDFREVLPEGFLERIDGVGKVIGWAPQMAVLAHKAVGGFVSHCGWNSTLESVWCGVPMATFPLYAEQQLNAFELVKELGLAEEIRIDYKTDLMSENDEAEIVRSEEIEAAIRRLMSGEGVRRKVEEMKEKSRSALMEGGSSYSALSLFIDDVVKNIEFGV